MSSSTVTKPYLTESWIPMHKHGFNEKKPPEDGKYAKSTASSRSRGAKEEDGMSQTGIHEAFADAENRFNKQQQQKTFNKILGTHRKSTSTVELKKPVNSPRLNAITTKKPNESSVKPKIPNQSRRQTISGILQTPLPTATKKPISVNSNNNSMNARSASISVSGANQQGGFVSLNTSFRDKLAERKKEELNKSRNTQVNDMIHTATRRQSVAKEKLRNLDQPRTRTISNGPGLQSLPSSPQTKPTKPIEASYMKSTLAADKQRRQSVAVTRTTSSPRRKINNAIHHKAESPFQSEDDRESPVPVGISALKRKSILCAVNVKARQQQQQCPDIGTNSSSGDEKPMTKTAPPMRPRKKSLGLLDTDRRMSRTESLKEGVPTSPSMAARMARRKSVIKQESPINPDPTSKRLTVVDPNNKKVPYQRKRGKTLPGNLAKPPTVQSLQLPPMKMGPINVTIPKTSNTVAKSPFPVKSTISSQLKKKRMSLSSINTPIPSSSSSSSPVKKSISTRKAKGASHLGIPSSRRASMRAPSSTQVVTPPLRTSPTAIASPRVRPTRRQSVFEKSTKTKSQEELGYSGQRKISSAYASNSRKNSFVEDTIDKDKDKGGNRAISLHERLENLVAQHAIYQEDTDKRRSPLVYDHHHHRRYDSEDKYSMLTAEERARPQRIRDSLKMLDKEMVEAFSPNVPKSPSIAIKFYGHLLSPFEQNEIQRYPEVYFVGHQAKKIQAMPDASALNYGYDDERGDYKSVIGDHLGYRYEVLKELGRGTFGQVVKCYDHKTASIVAVKLIRNKRRLYAQAKTEIKILSDLVQWDPEDHHHNVRMMDSFNFRSHLCIVCECLSMNLFEFIEISGFDGVNITLVKRFTIQLIRSLSLLSRHGVIHCDLKPENILLKNPNRSTIKVIDFGSSCLENERVWTYIQSRFYRAPEIILGLDYTVAIDMWSLGCIVAELYTGRPIFPGRNEQEQLALIMEVLGVPDPALIQLSERRNLFFDRHGNPRVVLDSEGKKIRAGSKTLSQALQCRNALFLDFLQQCLMWDPAKRLTPERAFQHQWILQPAV